MTHRETEDVQVSELSNLEKEAYPELIEHLESRPSIEINRLISGYAIEQEFYDPEDVKADFALKTRWLAEQIAAGKASELEGTTGSRKGKPIKASELEGLPLETLVSELMQQATEKTV